MTNSDLSHRATHSQEGVQHTLEIVVPAEAMAEQLDTVTRAFRSRMRLPGFRRGKAPLSMVRQQFSDEIRQRMLDHAIPEHLGKELEARGLAPLDSPRLAGVDFDTGGPLTFSVQFDTAPAIAVTNTAFAARRPEVDVTREMVDEALENLRERAARLVPLEGGETAGTGTYARCEIALFAKDGKGKRLAEEDRFVRVGEEKILPGLNAQLDGLAVGDERTFITLVESGYPNELLVGKEVQCRVRVAELKRRALPDLDDEFAKDVGFDDLAALRQHAQSDLTGSLEAKADQNVDKQILEQFRSGNPVDVPRSLVERRLDDLVRRFAHDLAHQGIDPGEALDWNAFRSENTGNAENAIAEEMLLDTLAQQQGITVDDDAVTEQIRRQLEASEGGKARPLASVVQQMRKDGAFDSLRLELRRRLALDHLRHHATIQIDGGDVDAGDTGRDD